MKKRCRVLTALLLVVANGVQAAEPQTSERVSDAEGREAVDSLPRTAFFDSTPEAAKGAAGTVIRAEEFTGYELPPDARATRILYRSRSQSDHDTVASAVVVVPSRAPPAGGWPVLVWAHELVGVAPSCAPSLSKSLGPHTQTLVKEGIARGFAVVAVDYSGLGASGQYEYLWKESNANDVIFAAAAARAAVPQLAPAWVAIGHSEGGLAVWGVAEKMAKSHDPAYRGAVALAPTVDLATAVPRIAALPGQSFYPVYVAFGIKSVSTNFDTRGMLLPPGVNAYERLTTQVCQTTANALFESVKFYTILDPRWTAAPFVQRWINSNEVGSKRIDAPMFIAGGENDDIVPKQLIAARVKSLCGKGATLAYHVYPGDHESMMQTSLPDQMSWIMDRFQQQPAPRTCP